MASMSKKNENNESVMKTIINENESNESENIIESNEENMKIMKING
jgi:hypothetical protein